MAAGVKTGGCLAQGSVAFNSLRCRLACWHVSCQGIAFARGGSDGKSVERPMADGSDGQCRRSGVSLMAVIHVRRAATPYRQHKHDNTHDYVGLEPQCVRAVAVDPRRGR